MRSPMRTWCALPAAIAVYASLLACAIKIDHSLVTDSGADRPADRAILDADLAPDTSGADAVVDAAGDGARDQASDRTSDVRPADKPRADLLKCTANAVQGCSADSKSLVRCNASGVGTYLFSCGSYLCDALLKRCTGCDPAQPATCSGANRVTCSTMGLPQSAVCPLGCQNGSCCVDSDADGHSNCAGDCNNTNPDVHPGQTAYFAMPAGTSFDYNCDGKAEQQYGLVSCQMDAALNCIGSGWEGTVPACGASGNVLDCKKTGSTCIPTSQPYVFTQACR